MKNGNQTGQVFWDGGVWDLWDAAGEEGRYPPVEEEFVLGLGIPRDNSGRKESQEVKPHSFGI